MKIKTYYTREEEPELCEVLESVRLDLTPEQWIGSVPLIEYLEEHDSIKKRFYNQRIMDNPSGALMLSEVLFNASKLGWTFTRVKENGEYYSQTQNTHNKIAKEMTDNMKLHDFFINKIREESTNRLRLKPDPTTIAWKIVPMYKLSCPKFSLPTYVSYLNNIHTNVFGSTSNLWEEIIIEKGNEYIRFDSCFFYMNVGDGGLQDRIDFKSFGKIYMNVGNRDLQDRIDLKNFLRKDVK